MWLVQTKKCFFWCCLRFISRNLGELVYYISTLFLLLKVHDQFNSNCNPQRNQFTCLDVKLFFNILSVVWYKISDFRCGVMLLSWWCHDATPLMSLVWSCLYKCGPAPSVWKIVSECLPDWRQACSVTPPHPPSPPDHYKHRIVGRQRDGQCWSQLRGHWQRCTEAAWRKPLCMLEIS